MEAFIGEIRFFPFSYVPNGWLACNGALVDISMFTALYSLIGIRFGGDGYTSFALPNLIGGSPINIVGHSNFGVYGICFDGEYPQRP